MLVYKIKTVPSKDTDAKSKKRLWLFNPFLYTRSNLTSINKDEATTWPKIINIGILLGAFPPK